MKHCRGLLVLLIGILGGCAPAADPVPPVSDPDAVVETLVVATSTICVPYVVDEASIEQLTASGAIEKEVVPVHGVDVTGYVIEAPGRPKVTPEPGRDNGVGPNGERFVSPRGCRVQLKLPSKSANEVLERLKARLARDKYQALQRYKPYAGHDFKGPCWPKSGTVCAQPDSRPPFIVCISGRTKGDVTVRGLDAFKSFSILEVDVGGPDQWTAFCS
jgi:hypothetical protein